ncbi:hypothetical protein SCHPADRAFT_352315 [Schizopora paradoxa]|uniref:Uncharacterized protein n=1 Tax=Schizopora paradoxa TaxID=27342 RepID=A0A0H2RNU3_9AGAM|nr:hypothetical protein SCHPADRAFT_352315 [Schizopora paradoxa]
MVKQPFEDIKSQPNFLIVNSNPSERCPFSSYLYHSGFDIQTSLTQSKISLETRYKPFSLAHHKLCSRVYFAIASGHAIPAALDRAGSPGLQYELVLNRSDLNRMKLLTRDSHSRRTRLLQREA